MAFPTLPARKLKLGQKPKTGIAPLRKICCAACHPLRYWFANWNSAEEWENETVQDMQK
jgi:hypothetical protein